MDVENKRIEIKALENMINRISYITQMCEGGELKEIEKLTNCACQIANTLDQIRINERAEFQIEDVEIEE